MNKFLILLILLCGCASDKIKLESGDYSVKSYITLSNIENIDKKAVSVWNFDTSDYKNIVVSTLSPSSKIVKTTAVEVINKEIYLYSKKKVKCGIAEMSAKIEPVSPKKFTGKLYLIMDQCNAEPLVILSSITGEKI